MTASRDDLLRAHQAAQQAHQLIVFADGMEAVGYADYARRARVVAREAIWLAGELEAERSARRAIQRQRDDALELLGKRAYDACKVKAEA